MLAALTEGPAAYVPRSNWPAWAALPAAVVIFGVAAFLGVAVSLAYGFGVGTDPANLFAVQTMKHTIVWLAAMQIGVIPVSYTHLTLPTNREV